MNTFDKSYLKCNLCGTFLLLYADGTSPRMIERKHIDGERHLDYVPVVNDKESSDESMTTCNTRDSWILGICRMLGDIYCHGAYSWRYGPWHSKLLYIHGERLTLQGLRIDFPLRDEPMNPYESQLRGESNSITIGICDYEMSELLESVGDG